MKLVEVKAEIPAGQAGLADEALLEHGLDCWSVLEDVPAKRAWVVGILADETGAQGEWESVKTALIAAGLKPGLEATFRSLADADWRESYKEHFKPSKFGRLHWVPVWQRNTYPVPAGDRALWLDPGLAFGTGNHE